MPRVIDSDLLNALERPNPRVRTVVEIATPDVSHVLRRASDQFFTAPPRFSETPALSTEASAEGALGLKATVPVDAFAEETGVLAGSLTSVDDHTRFFEFLRWTLDPAFTRARLNKFKAKVGRTGTAPNRYRLQIYRATAVPGTLEKRNVAGVLIATPFTQWSFTPLLDPPPMLDEFLSPGIITWTADQALLDFPLSNYGLDVSNSPVRSPNEPGEETAYFFIVESLTNQLVGWLKGNAVRVVAGVGNFFREEWSRATDADQWVKTTYTQCQNFRIEVDTYPATSTVIYALDMGAVPNAAATGRVVFERSVPAETGATMEVSTAGSGGPWTAVTHGQALTVAQQTYHTRLVLTATGSMRSTPLVTATGIEFRIPVDATPESQVQLLPREVAPPWLTSSVGEADLGVIRFGRRDFEDIGGVISSTKPVPKLEADIYLATPTLPRQKWLHLERALVTTGNPTQTSERFTLLSFLSKLKRKIPQRIEMSPSSVHTVASVTGTPITRITVSGATPLVGTTGGGHQYDGQGYFVRVRTAADSPSVGRTHRISGSTDTDKLDFIAPGAFPYTVATNDVIEVHSGRYTTDSITWQNADPATVWWELLTVHGGIAPERVGLAGIGKGRRSGLPPLVTNRAPLDATTQAKLKVTRRLDEPTELDKLIAEISFILGGATIEVQGQIVFVQIYTLYDATGNAMVMPSATPVTFDPRDYTDLQTPRGLEARGPIIDAPYGVNDAAADDEAAAPKTWSFVDSDALNWLGVQDLEDFGTKTVPQEISRWLYNTADAGAFLAKQVTDQVGLAVSTGLRVWSWTAVEDHHELIPGDVVTIITDQYTDFDPYLQKPIKGWGSYQLVIIAATAGRKFRGFMKGLPGNVVLLQGGPGTLAGSTASIAVPTDVLVNQVQQRTQTGGIVYLRATYTPPSSPFFDHMEYEIRTRTAGSPSWSAAPLVQGGRSGDDKIEATWNTDFEVTPVTVSSGLTRTKGTAVVVVVGENPEANPTFATPIASATAIVYPFTLDVDTAFVDVWSTWYTADPGAVQTVEIIGTWYPPIQKGDGRTSISFPVDATNLWRVTTFIAYDALNQRGTTTTFKTQRNAGATAPAAPASAASQSNPAGGPVVNRVTLAGTHVAGDYIRMYRGGVQLGSDVILVAGDITAVYKDVTDSTTAPSTAYSYEYSAVRAGVESTTKTGALSIATPAATIPTPSLSANPANLSYNIQSQGFDVKVTKGANTPADVLWHLKVGTPNPPTVEDTTAQSTSVNLFNANGQTASDVTFYFKVWGTKAGYTDSAESNVVSKVRPGGTI